MPLVKRLKIGSGPSDGVVLNAPLPARYFRGNYKGLDVVVAINGKDPQHGVDSVGTLSAGLTTHAVLKLRTKTDILLNVGTAGGYKSKGVKVGDVVFATHMVNHDRRISPPHPDPNFGKFGNSLIECFATPKLTAAMNWKSGICRTGNSILNSEEDAKALVDNGATVKDMEGAAVAQVAKYHKTPFKAIKVVSDLIDGGSKDQFDKAFEANLPTSGDALAAAVSAVLDFMSGKNMQQL